MTGCPTGKRGMMLADSLPRRLTVDSQTLMLVGISIAGLLLALVVWAYTSRRRRGSLRERSGREYERTVGAVGPARADSVLRKRADCVSPLDLRKRTQAQIDAFAGEWGRWQSRFA